MMNVIKKVKNSKGFISIEYMLIAGAIVLLAAIVLVYFNGKATTVAESAGNQLEATNEKMNGDDSSE